MSFVYPLKIRITRPGAQAGVGYDTTYAADQQSTEKELIKGVAASIQFNKVSGNDAVGLPADGKDNYWKVYTKPRALACITLKNRDLVYDSIGRKFQVVGDYVDSLGGCFTVLRLEA
jgi:hypothetical protein